MSVPSWQIIGYESFSSLILIALAIQTLLPETEIERLYRQVENSIDVRDRPRLSAAAAAGTATAAVRQCFGQRLHHLPVIGVDHGGNLDVQMDRFGDDQ